MTRAARSVDLRERMQGVTIPAYSLRLTRRRTGSGILVALLTRWRLTAAEGLVMTMERRTALTGIVLAAALALAMALLAGCGQTPAAKIKGGPTALDNLAVARSALTTRAPDAKLLVVQTAQGVEPTGTPVWGYLFGSPSTDKIYIVYVAHGTSMGAQEYGKAGLSKAEWAKVPGTDSWKIDSPDAYSKALAASGAKGAPRAYMMGLMTYKPQVDTSTAEPFVWSVRFDPGKSGATTRTIDVNANTGAATVSKVAPSSRSK
jgi:hypothetical protein